MRGKVLEQRAAYHTVGDHPRLCGEKFPSHVVNAHFPGSPPPMRGKVRPTHGHGQQIRITPAYAGKRGDIPLSFMTL